jgi:cell division protein FtsQ
MFRMGKKKRGTRRGTIRRPATRLDVFFVWLRRFGVVSGLALVGVWFAAWLWLSGSFVKATDYSHKAFLEASAEAGFSVKNILVEGRVHIEADTLMALLDVEKETPIFAFDLAAAQKRIEALSWVKSLRLERRLPDTIYVGLQEREPLALWQNDNKLFLIDEDGVVLTDKGLKKFEDFILVLGKDAPENAKIMIRTLEAEPDVLAHIEAASWIGGRRWNLITYDGISIKLPEADIGLALRRLAGKQEISGILNKNLDHIDLRNPDRIIVQVAPGKVQDYDAKGQDASFKADGGI